MCRIQTIQSFGKALQDGRLYPFALLLHYISYTQKQETMATLRVSFHGDEDYVYLDDTTIKNLEIFASSYESTEKYSLF